MNTAKKNNFVFLVVTIAVMMFFCICTIVFAENQQQIKVAVINFKADNISELDTEVAVSALRTALTAKKCFKVISPKKMRRVLSKSGISIKDCCEKDSAMVAGRKLKAGNIIYGTISKEGGSYIVVANAVDMMTAEVMFSDTVHCNKLSQLPAVMIALADRLELKFNGKEVKEYGCSERKNFAVNLNYPGVGLKMFLSDKLCIEPKAQFGEDIFVGGGRISYYYIPGKLLGFYAGIEGDYVSFKGELSEGSGVIVEPYLGIEFFSSKNISIQFDIGYVYIGLTDKNEKISVSGTEVGSDIGVNLYF